MQETLDNLLKRSLNMKDSTIGDPFEVIPIKNLKYAKNCTEIHLAERNLEQITGFDKFPNLECLWLNENKFESLKGLEANFRLRELYVHDNKLKTLEGSIPTLVHLRRLSLYNNEIRNLDKTLEALKDLTQLQQLGNPVAEEPNYRLRVIYHIPSLLVFDRHVVTLEERNKAKQWYENETKGIVKKKPVKKESAWKPSQTEKEIGIEAKQILKKYDQQRLVKEEENKNELKERFKKWYKEDIPTPTFLIESHKKLQNLPIKEWDKIHLMAVFQAYDKDKKGAPFKTLESLYKDLIEDKGFIGLVPSVPVEQFVQLFGANEKEKPTVKWEEFRGKLDNITWTIADSDYLKKRIDDLYKQANKFINTGQGTNAPVLLQKANRLENVLSRGI